MKNPKAIRINIPTPCHENWQKMTPNEQGRFCASCQKTVVDFTGWTDGDLLEFLSKNNNDVCGKFTTEQIATNTNYIRQSVSPIRLFTIAILGSMSFIFTPISSIAQNIYPLTTQNKFPRVKEKNNEQQRLKIDQSGISGIITDDRTNEIIIGAVVWLSDTHGNVITATSTDINGYFGFENLKPGHYKVSAKFITYDKIESKTIRVYENKFTTVNLRLPPAHLTGLAVVTVVYPKHYWLKHPWQFIKRKIFKINPL